MGTATDGVCHQKSEKKMRRLWKSFSVDPQSDHPSPGVEELLDHGQGVRRFGAVVSDLKQQMAEQGDTTAQLDLAREILISVTDNKEISDEEVSDAEERAMYWLLRAAEQGSDEARETIKVETLEIAIDNAHILFTRVWWRVDEVLLIRTTLM